MNIKYTISIILFLLSINLWSQSELSLYNLNYSVPQSNQLNPAFYSHHKVVVGLPALSSAHVGLSLDQLSFSNMFTQNNNYYHLDYDKLANKLNDQNFIGLQAELQLFYFALNLRKSHFTLSVNEKVNSQFAYSGDILKTAIYGNANSELLGKKIDFAKMDLYQTAYHEIALGFARDINDKLTIGIKVKYLAGIANVQVKDLNGYAVTTDEEIHIEHDGFSVNTTGNAFVYDDNNLSTVLSNTLPGKNKNTGFAFDFGAKYKMSDKINLSASISDLGSIHWQDDTKKLVFNPVNYSFKGFEILKVLDNANSDEYMQNEVDSLEQLFTTNEVDSIKYTSSLSAHANLGFDYAIFPSHHIGVLVNSMMLNSKSQTTIGAYYNFRPKKIFNATLNVALRNGKFSTFGVGASLDLGPFQIFGTSESLTSFIKPDKASIVDARIGINMVFGKYNKQKDI